MKPGAPSTLLKSEDPTPQFSIIVYNPEDLVGVGGLNMSGDVGWWFSSQLIPHSNTLLHDMLAGIIHDFYPVINEVIVWVGLYSIAKDWNRLGVQISDQEHAGPLMLMWIFSNQSLDRVWLKMALVPSVSGAIRSVNLYYLCSALCSPPLAGLWDWLLTFIIPHFGANPLRHYVTPHKVMMCHSRCVSSGLANF